MAHMSMVSQAKRAALPPEAEIFERLQAGDTAEAIAKERGIQREAIMCYIRDHRQAWAMRPPVRVKPDSSKIVIQRLVYEDEAYRYVDISLPRINMHVHQIAEAGR